MQKQGRLSGSAHLTHLSQRPQRTGTSTGTVESAAAPAPAPAPAPGVEEEDRIFFAELFRDLNNQLEVCACVCCACVCARKRVCRDCKDSKQ